MQAGQQGLPVSLNLVPLRFFSRESVSVVEYVKLCRNLLYYCIIISLKKIRYIPRQVR